MRLRIGLFALLVGFGLVGFDAIGVSGPDLALESNSISFSTSKFIAGETIRVYAAVRNYGDGDGAAEVYFYSGPAVIGSSQVATVRAFGFNDEVYVDFVVPDGPFNILAVIKGANPADVNPNNDELLTPSYTVIHDDDLDGVIDESDNCVEVANADQADSDNDLVGDACDPTPLPPPPPPPPPSAPVVIATPVPTSTPTSTPTATPTFPSAQPSTPTIKISTGALGKGESDLVVAKNQDQLNPIDPNTGEEIGLLGKWLGTKTTDDNSVYTAYGFPALAIVATRLNWLSYQFELLPTVSQMTYAWDFGDGVAVTADNPEHKFSGSGEHLVKLVISDATGEVWNVEKTVTISFWSWENGLVKGIVFGLIGSIILCVYIAFHLYRKKIPEVEG